MITRYHGSPLTENQRRLPLAADHAIVRPLASGVPFVPSHIPSSLRILPAGVTILEMPPIREGRFDLGEGWALVLEVSCDQNTCLATLTNDAESVTELYGDGPGFPDAILALLLRAKRLKLKLPTLPASRFYLITDRASTEVFAHLTKGTLR